MKIWINQKGTLTNKQIDIYTESPSLISWVLNALSLGFKVKSDGCLCAIKDRVKIFTHTQGDYKEVWLTHNSEKDQFIARWTYDKFSWDKLKLNGNIIYYDSQVICHTKDDVVDYGDIGCIDFRKPITKCLDSAGVEIQIGSVINIKDKGNFKVTMREGELYVFSSRKVSGGNRFRSFVKDLNQNVYIVY